METSTNLNDYNNNNQSEVCFVPSGAKLVNAREKEEEIIIESQPESPQSLTEKFLKAHTVGVVDKIFVETEPVKLGPQYVGNPIYLREQSGAKNIEEMNDSEKNDFFTRVKKQKIMQTRLEQSAKDLKEKYPVVVRTLDGKPTCIRAMDIPLKQHLENLQQPPVSQNELVDRLKSSGHSILQRLQEQERLDRVTKAEKVTAKNPWINWISYFLPAGLAVISGVLAYKIWGYISGPSASAQMELSKLADLDLTTTE